MTGHGLASADGLASFRQCGGDHAPVVGGFTLPADRDLWFSRNNGNNSDGLDLENDQGAIKMR